jgi:biotin transport system substrate-specific component
VTTGRSSTASAPATLADLLPGTAMTRAIRDVLLVAGGALLTGLAAQAAFRVPWTEVPYTLQTGAVLLVGTALGSRRGGASMIVYLLAGAIGLPAFAGGRSGLEGAAGGITPTLGYLLGFVAAATVVGWLAERRWDRSARTAAGLMLVGNVVIYAVGVPLLAIVLGLPLPTAIWEGAAVFVPWDLAKVALAAGILPLAWRLAGEGRRGG